jgi:hypothetical protein
MFALDLFFFHRSILFVGPGLATLLANFQVFILALAGVVLLGERLNWQTAVSIPLAVLGLATIVGFDWLSLRPAELLDTFRSYLGLGRASKLGPIDTPEALAHFIETRASFIAQTSLYGYLRTRMGMRYPELFDDDVFVVSINLAKWQIWLDCLGDLGIHAGARIAQAHPREADRVAEMMTDLIEGILERTGVPGDAGPQFRAHRDRLRDRIAQTDWLAMGDREAAFSESPASVVHWAPIADELKELDEEIVRNSVRFHWQEVRRAFTAHLDAPALLGLDRPDGRPAA